MHPLESSHRHPHAKRIKHISRIAMKIGFIISISLTIFAFNWTSYKDMAEIPIIDAGFDEEEVKMVRTVHKKKRVPPPPVLKPSTEIIEEDIEFTPEPEPEKIEEKVVVDMDKEPVDLPFVKEPKVEKIAPPPPIDELEPEEDIEFMIVEEMPRFVGCEDLEGDKYKRQMCADEKLLKYIYSNIKYPAIALETGVEGVVVIQFVVGKDGRISDVKITKDIGAGCGKETLRVAKNMPKWIAGKQRGKPVKVRYNLPVKFKLKY